MFLDFFRKRKETQTVLPVDDFEKACEESGVEIKDQEELPEGIGAAYTPRLTAPTPFDKNWIHYTADGYNYCIKIYGNSCLPNCVGYAWGRWRELLGKFHNLSRNNAEVWFLNTKDGYKRGQTPKLGAVICWRKGIAGDGSDGAGHVAIVEKVEPDGTITCSNSAYLGTRFYLSTHKPPYSISGYAFQGFIYNPNDYQQDRLEVDGVFGFESIKALQEWLGVYADGIISGQIKSEKKWFPNITNCTYEGTGSATIEALQKFLKHRGLAPGEIDGLMGKNTITAWQKYIKSQGHSITADGIFGPASARAMQRILNSI